MNTSFKSFFIITLSFFLLQCGSQGGGGGSGSAPSSQPSVGTSQPSATTPVATTSSAYSLSFVLDPQLNRTPQNQGGVTNGNKNRIKWKEVMEG